MFTSEPYNGLHILTTTAALTFPYLFLTVGSAEKTLFDG